MQKRRKLKDLAIAVNAELPMSTRSRPAAMQELVMKLNENLGGEHGVCGIEVHWGRSTVCPMDGLSLFMKKPGSKQEQEVIVACVEWETLPERAGHSITEFMVLGSYANKLLDDVILARC